MSKSIHAGALHGSCTYPILEVYKLHLILFWVVDKDRQTSKKNKLNSLDYRKSWLSWILLPWNIVGLPWAI